MRENLKKTSITKKVNLHTLRHTYATPFARTGIEYRYAERPAGTFRNNNNHDLPACGSVRTRETTQSARQALWQVEGESLSLPI
jgi:hypothetical protein